MVFPFMLVILVRVTIILFLVNPCNHMFSNPFYLFYACLSAHQLYVWGLLVLWEMVLRLGD